MTFYHFTCRHAAEHIRAVSELRPWGPPGGPFVVWLTDLPKPPRDAVGLSSYLLSCDRMEERFTVAPCPDVVPWWKWRRAHPECSTFARVLESEPGARPAHWYVSDVPLPVEPES